MVSIGALAIVFAAAAAAWLYNHLVRGRNRVDTAWSDIDVQLQRRHDLIPSLVKAVDQYASYERATLEAVTELRAEAMRITDVGARGRAEEALGTGIVRLIALAENYPDLKANEKKLGSKKTGVEPKFSPKTGCQMTPLNENFGSTPVFLQM